MRQVNPLDAIATAADDRGMTSPDNEDLRAAFAAGETEAMPPSTADVVRKDTTYGPGSETETEHKQQDPLPDTLDDDIDTDAVRAVPGTGGPDDVGDVDVDPGDLDLPWRESGA